MEGNKFPLVMAAPEKRRHVVALFDVDGTLTIPRGEITPEMETFLAGLRGRISTGVLGGSDISKQKEQLGPRNFDLFDDNFAEHGLVALKEGKLLAESSLAITSGTSARWALPVKRGTFIEYRMGMINISPIGRS